DAYAEQGVEDHRYQQRDDEVRRDEGMQDGRQRPVIFREDVAAEAQRQRQPDDEDAARIQQPAGDDLKTVDQHEAGGEDQRGADIPRVPNRRPGEGRDPPLCARDVEKWIPACAGMTTWKAGRALERRARTLLYLPREQ